MIDDGIVAFLHEDAVGCWTTTMKTKTLLTADDYFALPDDGKLYELLAGELYVNPTPSFRHQDVAKRLFLILDVFSKEKGSARSSSLPRGRPRPTRRCRT